MVAGKTVLFFAFSSLVANVSGVENFLASREVSLLHNNQGMSPSDLADLAFSMGDSDGSGYLEEGEIEELRSKLVKLSPGFAALDWHKYDSEGASRLSREDLHTLINDP